MTRKTVTVRLEAADGAARSGQGVLYVYSPVDRFRRAAAVFGIALVMAAALIPIPIVHLLGIPLVLLLGIFVATRQLTIHYRLEPIRLACPRCEGVNRIGGGLGMRSVAEPIDRMCEHCRRALHVRIDD